MPSGYYRFPTLFKDNLVFVCEDDLWSVPATGGIARRLTSNLGEVSSPALSPDGEHLAFVGREEGLPEVYVMPSIGGQAKRLTFMGGYQCRVVGWTPEGNIAFASNANQPFTQLLTLHQVRPTGGPVVPVSVGPARAVSFGDVPGAMVLGRNTGDPARWKRYRGGTTGRLWIDRHGKGKFTALIHLEGDLTSPMWIGKRIYFLSDHQGVGNLYSCTLNGKWLKRHTDHADFYARNATTDGRRIAYHAGADLFLFEPENGRSQKVEIAFHSPQMQRNRKFVRASRYLETYTLHPEGHSVALSVRGKPFTMGNWEGPAIQHGSRNGVRYRLPTWMEDGAQLLLVSDEGGEEAFIVIDLATGEISERFSDLDIGRPEILAVAPKSRRIAFSNHRHELIELDLDSGELTIIDKGRAGSVAGFDWSPDGRWLVYSASVSHQVSVLRLWNAVTRQVHPLTRPLLHDVSPAFDRKGQFIYFLSKRHFDPVHDNLQFDLGFPRGEKPYLITLRSDRMSPFVPQPRPLTNKENQGSGDQAAEHPPAPAESDSANAALEQDPEITEPNTAAEETGGTEHSETDNEDGIQIDLEGIEDRVLAFPTKEGLFGRVASTKEGAVLYSVYPVESSLSGERAEGRPPSNGTLLTFDFDKIEERTLVSSISDFNLNADGSHLIYRSRYRLRVLKAGAKPDKSAGGFPGRQSGWLDLNRLKISIDPGAEWRQMFREAWRLQRDHFWTPDMSKVDWVAIHDRYLPLVDRVSSRAEFSDLMWEMQGELATSHCYELGGDYRPQPHYGQGYLAARFGLDAERGSWQILQTAKGDSWEEESHSPLRAPGLGLQSGDWLLAINGQQLSRNFPPEAALVNMAGVEVALTVDSGEGGNERTIHVKTLRRAGAAWYRDWVNENRRSVHEATEGHVGYVHIPDMGANGYAEFHRGYLAEVDRPALLVDVRFNLGGNVSALILEKLARRRIGYDIARWSEEPLPYPPESVLGPMVAIINEFAGSDGDIFAHGFKLLKLGPLVGKRTWGGVIGIWPRQSLVDGTVTTQPEYSAWFEEVGWGLENYGTEPDIEVEIKPADYAAGQDPQLERAIEVIQKLLEEDPPELPDFSQRPDRALPKLPRRR